MNGHSAPDSGSAQPGNKRAQDKQDKRAAALRDNLKKRKAQQQSRSQAGKEQGKNE
jgi:hypothetical protein